MAPPTKYQQTGAHQVKKELSDKSKQLSQNYCEFDDWQNYGQGDGTMYETSSTAQ